MADGRLVDGITNEAEINGRIRHLHIPKHH